MYAMSVDEMREWRKKKGINNTAEDCGYNFDDEPVPEPKYTQKTAPIDNDEVDDEDPVDLTVLFHK